MKVVLKVGALIVCPYWVRYYARRFVRFFEATQIGDDGMPSLSRCRCGFTLVELLVVIAIIGVLVALLLPAVQSAREAARRAQCQNHLKQLGLALLNFHNTQKEFPRGAYTADSTASRREDGLGWATKLLPYIEENAIYDRLVNNNIVFGSHDFRGDPWQPNIFVSAANTGNLPLPGGEITIQTFRCPSVDLPELVPDESFFGGSGQKNNFGHAVSHYKGSRGYCDRGMFLRTEEMSSTNSQCDDGADIDGDGNIPDFVQKRPYKRIRIANVEDGTSKTIATGEAAYVVDIKSFPMWIGTYIEDGSILFKTRDPINCNIGGARAFPLSANEALRLPGNEKKKDDCTFSWHSGGAFFGFVDGSVHFLAESLDLRIFALLGDRLDGQIIEGLD